VGGAALCDLCALGRTLAQIGGGAARSRLLPDRLLLGGKVGRELLERLERLLDLGVVERATVIQIELVEDCVDGLNAPSAAEVRWQARREVAARSAGGGEGGSSSPYWRHRRDR